MRIFSIAAAVTLLSSSALAQQAFTIEPGNYKTTMTMSASMMPKPMTNTTEHCVTAEEASKTPKDILDDMAQQGECSSSNMTNGPGRMAFDFQCTGGEMGSMTGRYDLQYKDASYTFTGNMNGNMQGMPIKMDMKGDAQRIGPC